MRDLSSSCRSGAVNTQTDRTRAITTDPIGPLMVRLTLPMILAIVSMMLLGVVDMYFISLLGLRPLAAAGFSLPITGMLTSVGLGIGMGQSANTSRLIGEQRRDDAARFVSDTQILALAIGCTLALVGYLSIDWVFGSLGADNTTLPYVRDYMSVWYLGLPLIMLNLLATNAMRAIGDTRSSAKVSLTMSLLNLVLDPIFIFGFGPIPAMGIQGAAVATLIAVGTSLSLALWILGTRERLLNHTRLPRWAHLGSNWRTLLQVGVPAIGANLMTPLAATAMTAIIARYGAAAVAGFGVGARVEALALLLVLAMSATLPMFIGQNMGANKPHRAWEALMLCLRFAVLLQLLIWAALWLAAPWIARAYGGDPQVGAVIESFLRILPLTYGAHGIVILVMVSLNVLQAPRLALLLTVLRLAVLYVPLAYAGAHLAGVTGLFVGAAVGNVLAALVAIDMLRRVAREQGLIAVAPASA